jgi:bacterioferritin-associated ferredoxin
MYICICNAVTDKQIRRAAASGADSLPALRKQLGVASGCGTCASDALEILREHESRVAVPTLYVPCPA